MIAIEPTLKAQISDDFLKGMVARMEMSYFKYARRPGSVPGEGLRDRLAVRPADPLSRPGAVRREGPRGTGRGARRRRGDASPAHRQHRNLIDAANFAMIEFMLPRHEGAFFEPTDADQSPGRLWTHRTEATQSANTESRELSRHGQKFSKHEGD